MMVGLSIVLDFDMSNVQVKWSALLNKCAHVVFRCLTSIATPFPP